MAATYKLETPHPSHQMPAATIHETKAAALATYPADADAVIIQHRGTFRVYTDAASLDADATLLAGRGRTLEMLERDVPRRAFADVDFTGARTDSMEGDAAAAFAAEFGVAVETVMKLPTDNGIHLIADRVVSAADHKNGLLNLAANHPAMGFDVAATHSLRLAGTVSLKGSRKELPAGMLLSATLCQPWGLRAQRPAAQGEAEAAEPVTQDADLARQVSLAIGGAADVFVKQAGPRRGASIQFNRTRRAHCAVCERDHDSAGVYAYLFGDGNGQVFCCRAPNGRGIVFSVHAAHGPAAPMTPEQRGRLTGAFPAVTPDIEYNAAPRHEGGAGCIAPSGDYIDGTQCGMGKSEAAWSSVPAGASVVVVSYRRAFTAKTAADHKLESYANIRGPIKMWKGRRVIIQADSLSRIVDAPDVLIVDEFHGIRRQLFGSLAAIHHRGACNSLARLIHEAGRVIVLDADADDADVDAIEEARGVRPKFIRNTYKPNHMKHLTQYSGHIEMRDALARWVSVWSAKSGAERAADKLVVFCHLPNHVEEVAKQLLARGMRVRYYHGKTCQVKRAADFAAASITFAAVDAVVYNSSVEAGISIEDAAYKTMFVYSNRLGSCEVLKQAMHRFRCVDQFHYAARAAFDGAAGPTTEVGVYKWLEAKRAGLTAHEGDDINLATAPDYAEARHTFRSRMWVACHLDSARSRKHYDARLMKMLRETGMSVAPYVSGAAPAAPAVPVVLAPVAIPAALAESPEERIARVRAASHAPDGEERVDGKPRTADEMAAQEKKAIKNCYGVLEADIDAAFVEKFGGAEKMEQRKRYERSLKGHTTNQNTEDFASEIERFIMVNDVLALAGLGSLSQLDRTRTPAADLATRAATPEAAALFVRVKQQWPRVFGGITHHKPTGDVVAGVISTRVLVGLVRCMINCYGMSLENTNKINPSRGLYYIKEFEWPVPMMVRDGSSDPDDLVEQSREAWALSLRGFDVEPSAAHRAAAPRTPNEARALREAAREAAMD